MISITATASIYNSNAVHFTLLLLTGDSFSQSVLSQEKLKSPFYFLLPISRESIVLGSNFRSGNFDGFTRFEVS